MFTDEVVPAMSETTFLEMCRLVSSDDTGGQWTDEKIDAIEVVTEIAPRDVVRRLYRLCTAATRRAEAAEADAAWLRAELSTTARLHEAERLAVAATVLELTQANIELAAINADLTERAEAAEAALAAVPMEALHYLYRSDDEYRNNTDLHYYVECQRTVRAWLDAQQRGGGGEYYSTWSMTTSNPPFSGDSTQEAQP